MGYHYLYIFTTCGHSTFATHPLLPCAASHSQPRRTLDIKPLPDLVIKSSSPTPPNSKPRAASSMASSSKPLFADLGTGNRGKGKGPIFPDVKRQENGCHGPRAHPFQSFRIYRLCAVRTRRRNALLAKVEEGKEVRFEDWRWKVKYQSPRADEGRWKDWGSVGEVMGWRVRRGEEGKGVVRG
ncbi:hypothetical protein V2W45_1449562 [Cenococcum geophilum]